MKLFVFRALAVLTVLGCWCGVFAADFSQADLEKMVRELESVMPEDPKLLYPIKCSVVNKAEVNAYATATKEGDKFRATMVVFSGLVDFAQGDLKRVRAVVAHEVAHLSRGHVTGPAPAARDASNLWTRQQEFDADMLWRSRHAAPRVLEGRHGGHAPHARHAQQSNGELVGAHQRRSRRS